MQDGETGHADIEMPPDSGGASASAPAGLNGDVVMNSISSLIHDCQHDIVNDSINCVCNEILNRGIQSNMTIDFSNG